MATATTHPRASLLTLPNELLLVILDYASPLLHGITLANRRLHALSIPFLYSTFSYDTWVPDPFLRTICQSHDLARHVRGITLNYDIAKAEYLSLAPEEVARCLELRLDVLGDTLVGMSASGNKLADWIQEELKPGRKYLGDLRGLYLMLMFTTNVEHLRAYETYKWDKSLSWFMPLVESRTNALSRLTSVKLNGPMRLQNVVALMIIPSMRHMELEGVFEVTPEQSASSEWHSGSRWQATLNEYDSRIEHFHLYNSYLQLENVALAVKAMIRLKSLVYEHSTPDWNLRYMALFEPEPLAKLVQSRGRTLTTLKVSDKSHYPPQYAQTIALYPIMESLPHVVDLELAHVKLSETTFPEPGSQPLPASLEHLTLDFVELHMYDAARDFVDLDMCLEMLVARKIQGDLPHLRSLTLTQWHPWYGCIPTNVDYAKNLLQNAGIEFSSIPEEIGLRYIGDEDIGWMEIQTEPGWVFVDMFIH